MRLDDVSKCSNASCPIWKHCGNKVTIFLTDIRSKRLVVFVKKFNNELPDRYRATWNINSICSEHYQMLLNDYEQLGRDEVSEYNAMTAYYDRRGR
jgi:hypothetical protein